MSRIGVLSAREMHGWNLQHLKGGGAFCLGWPRVSFSPACGMVMRMSIGVLGVLLVLSLLWWCCVLVVLANRNYNRSCVTSLSLHTLLLEARGGVLIVVI